MTGLFSIGGALTVAVLGSELALRGPKLKLQTGVSRVLVVWTSAYLATTVLLPRYEIGPVAFTIFWWGAFCSWFGCTSHIESSILLRMLYLLRQRPMTDADLLAEYAVHYGEALRSEQLVLMDLFC